MSVWKGTEESGEGSNREPSGSGGPPDLKGSGWMPTPADPPAAGAASRSVSMPTQPVDAVSGEVRDFRERSEYFLGSLPIIVWTFRLEQYDQHGNPRTSTPVVMRGRSFRGYLGNGNHVEIPQVRKRGRDVRTKRLYNLTSESWVEAKGYGPLMLASMIIVMVFLAILVVLGIWAYRTFTDRVDPFEVPSEQGGEVLGSPTEDELPTPMTPIATASVSTESSGPTVPTSVTVSCTPAGGPDVDVAAAVGQTVVWSNAGTDAMELDFSGPVPNPVGEIFQPGDAHEALFEEAGSFVYTCVFPTNKQSGEVVVTE